MTQKFHHPSQAKSSGLDEVFQIQFSKTCGPGQGPTCFQENNIKTPGGFRYIDVLRCCNCFWIGEMMPLDCIYIYTVCMRAQRKTATSCRSPAPEILTNLVRISLQSHAVALVLWFWIALLPVLRDLHPRSLASILPLLPGTGERGL